MSTFFKPYEGTRPFVFISYAHLQSDAVVDTIRILHDKGWRLWYDEGIPAGSDWPANIARHMQQCERVIFFLSAEALASPNCYSEMRTAARLGKPVLVIRLDEAAEGERWPEQPDTAKDGRRQEQPDTAKDGRRQEQPDTAKDARWPELPDAVKDARWPELPDAAEDLPRLASPEERADAILRSGFLTGRFHRSRTEKIPWRAAGFAASLLFFLAAAGMLGALASGFWNPFPPAEPPAGQTVSEPAQELPPSPAVVDLGEAERFFAVTFSDPLLEEGIRAAIGAETGEISRGQLADISELYFCGGLSAERQEDITSDADGTFRVNGAPVLMGPITDPGALRYAVRLEKLALVCQPLEDLSALSGHVLLKELSLAGSTVEDLSALTDLPGLETLHLEYTDVSDLTPLDAFPRLQTVTVSRDMLPLKWNEDAPFEVVLAAGR